MMVGKGSSDGSRERQSLPKEKKEKKKKKKNRSKQIYYKNYLLMCICYEIIIKPISNPKLLYFLEIVHKLLSS